MNLWLAFNRSSVTELKDNDTLSQRLSQNGSDRVERLRFDQVFVESRRLRDVRLLRC
jgi:hypothetical protein